MPLLFLFLTRFTAFVKLSPSFVHFTRSGQFTAHGNFDDVIRRTKTRDCHDGNDFTLHGDVVLLPCTDQEGMKKFRCWAGRDGSVLILLRH